MVQPKPEIANSPLIPGSAPARLALVTLPDADAAPAFGPTANPARNTITSTIARISVPCDHRVRLWVTVEGPIALSVERRVGGWELFRIFGRPALQASGQWETVRELQADTYEALLNELEHHPEFLEFDLSFTTEGHFFSVYTL